MIVCLKYWSRGKWHNIDRNKMKLEKRERKDSRWSGVSDEELSKWLARQVSLARLEAI